MQDRLCNCHVRASDLALAKAAQISTVTFVVATSVPDADKLALVQNSSRV